MKSRLPLFKYTQFFNFTKRITPIKRMNESLFPLHEHKDFIHTTKLRKPKTKLMTYNDNCKPFWMKIKADDPFDYKLRSKEEVYYQMFLYPPYWDINISYYVRFEDLLTKASSDGNQYNKIRLYVKIKEMKLFPLQEQRLIFLLGRRYKNNGILKLVCQQTDNIETNVAIARDTLKQLYLEALRAPIYMLDWLSKDEYDEFFLQYGKSPEQGRINVDSLFFNKDCNYYKKFLKFYSIVGNPEVSYEAKLKEWSKVILDRFEVEGENGESCNKSKKSSSSFLGIEDNDSDLDTNKLNNITNKDINSDIGQKEHDEDNQMIKNENETFSDNNENSKLNDGRKIEEFDKFCKEFLQKNQDVKKEELDDLKSIILEDMNLNELISNNNSEEIKAENDIEKYKVKDRESAYQGLIKNGLLTEKAYEMFIKNKK